MGQFSCGVQCTRFILFILNVLLIIGGFILLGFGVFLKVSKKFDAAFSDHVNAKITGGTAIEWLGVTMIIVAVFTVLLAAFGCLSAVFKNRCFLYIYAIILSLLIIIEVAAFIVTFTSRNSIRDSYKSGFRELFNEAYSHNHTDLQNVIENTERQLKCCGVQNVSDYYEKNFTVPETCYEDQNFNKTIFDKGCTDAAIDWIRHQFPIIGAVLGSILLIEIFGVISAITLGVAISHSSYDEIHFSNYR